MSVSVSIDLQGAEEFQQAMNRFDLEMHTQVQEQLDCWAQTVQAEAQRLVPVRTGYLQSTIYAKSQGWQLEVGAEAVYAAAVEFGTRFARAQPYLNPAVEAHLPELEDVILQALDSAKAGAEL